MRRRPAAAGCAATALLTAALLPGLGSLVLRDWRDGLATVAAQLLLLGPFVVRGGARPLRALARRLVPGVVAAVSVGWSTWLFGGRDPGVAAGAGLRVTALVLPGALLLAHLDPARLGDELGQWFRAPARPVLASVAALQQIEGMAEDWRTIGRARRSRGLGADRSPVARARAAGAMTVPLLIGALERAGSLSDAMAVRGLGAVPGRTWTTPARWSRVDTVLTVAAAILTAVPLVARFG